MVGFFVISGRIVNHILWYLPVFPCTLAHFSGININSPSMEITQADLIRLCDPYIGRRTIQRMFAKTEAEKVTPKLRTVIALCVMIKLNAPFSLDLVEKAGYHLRRTPEEDLLRCILEKHYKDDLNQLNEVLTSLGYDKLGG